jgi:hypothetical protein
MLYHLVINMKKIKVYFILLLFILTSCNRGFKDYKIIYKVYYPNNVIIKTHECNCKDIRLISKNGSNSIRYKTNGCNIHNWIEQTTAPIEIISILEN